MASIFEREPIFYLERTWDDNTKMPEKHKFLGKNGKKSKVHIDSGSLGMDFFTRRLSQTSAAQEMSSSGAGARHSQNLRMLSLAVTKLPAKRWSETTSPLSQREQARTS